MSRAAARGRSNALLGGLLVFAALAGASFPYYWSRTGPKTNVDKALSDNQVMRGPYVNTGSKDIGPDPGTSRR